MSTYSIKNQKAQCKKVLDKQQKKTSAYWELRRKQNTIRLFKKVASRVPAYRDFLKKNKINSSKVNSWDDFSKVPPINKRNYLTKYKLADLCWDGDLNRPFTLTATSGSTGNPVYFLRDQALDWQYSVILENFIKSGFNKKRGSVLVIVCFGMGLWIGGLITYKGFDMVAVRNNFPISIITPGLNKKEIFNALKKLASQYEQVIFAGYPPFIKDIIDEAVLGRKINFKKVNARFLFAAEAITEDFRDYLAKKSVVASVYKDFINIYGSADIGAMAFETGLSILVKRIANESTNVFEEIFSTNNKTPTLARFNPDFINFDEHKRELFLTGDSAMPLVKYAIGDHGGVLSYNHINKILRRNGIDLKKSLIDAKLDGCENQLPFVYVYERIDLSVTFYGLLIYPQWIRAAFLEEPLVKHATGKFTIIAKFDENQNQYLEINIELRKGKKNIRELEKRTMKMIVDHLRKSSSEYTELTNQLKERALPKIQFWKYSHPLHFSPGIKQKWVKKV